MPHRVPAHTIVVTRDGARVEAPPGKPFDFTAAEIAHLDQRPGSVRHLINELPVGDAGPREAEEIVAAKTPARPRTRRPAAADADL